MMYEHNNDAHAIVLIIIEKLMRQMYFRHKYVHEKISTYLGYDIERSASPETGAMLTKKCKNREKTQYKRKRKQKTPMSFPLC